MQQAQAMTGQASMQNALMQQYNRTTQQYEPIGPYTLTIEQQQALRNQSNIVPQVKEQRGFCPITDEELAWAIVDHIAPGLTKQNEQGEE